MAHFLKRGSIFLTMPMSYSAASFIKLLGASVKQDSAYGPKSFYVQVIDANITYYDQFGPMLCLSILISPNDLVSNLLYCFASRYDSTGLL